MTSYDFHGCKPYFVEQSIHSLVAAVRIANARTFVEIVTGRGSHRDLVMDLLKQYGLSPEYQLGNDGVIIVTVE